MSGSYAACVLPIAAKLVVEEMGHPELALVWRACGGAAGERIVTQMPASALGDTTNSCQVGGCCIPSEPICGLEEGQLRAPINRCLQNTCAQWTPRCLQ